MAKQKGSEPRVHRLVGKVPESKFDPDILTVPDWSPGSPEEVLSLFRQHLPHAPTDALLGAIADFRGQLKSIYKATNSAVSYTDDKQEIRRELLTELLRLAKLEAKRRKAKVEIRQGRLVEWFLGQLQDRP